MTCDVVEGQYALRILLDRVLGTRTLVRTTPLLKNLPCHAPLKLARLVTISTVEREVDGQDVVGADDTQRFRVEVPKVQNVSEWGPCTDR